VGLASLLAAGVLLYAWQHFQYIQMRYRLEELKSAHSQAVEFNQQLRLEIARLRSPSRVDTIARRLGLTAPVPGQIAPGQGPADAVLAQARRNSPSSAQ
jgi:hypothetical protein